MTWRARMKGLTALAAAVGLAAMGPGGAPALAADDPAAGVEEVPAELVDAVREDLGMTWEEFVRAGAQAETAVPTLTQLDTSTVGVLTADGVQVLPAQTLAGDGPVSEFTSLDQVREAYLREVGPEGLSSVTITLDGYTIRVTSPDEATDRGRLDDSGGTVSPSAWGAEHGVNVVEASGRAGVGAALRGGEGVSISGVTCSHGFNGFYKGDPTGISAGHCVLMGGGGTNVSARGSYVGTVDWWQFGDPTNRVETYGTDLSTYEFGSNFSHPPTIKGSGGGDFSLTGRVAPILGMPVCKSGIQTGWTCSSIYEIGWQWIGDGSGDITKPKRWVWSYFANTQIIPGDSGGPWVSGRKALGVTSSYDWHPDGRPFSTGAPLVSLDDYRSGVEVKVWLGRSRLPSATMTDAWNGRARWSNGQVISGTLTKFNGDSISPGTYVDVKVGSTVLARPQVARDGSFSFTYTATDTSPHTVTFQARAGSSRGDVVTVRDEPAGIAPRVDRLSGTNRYDTAARIVRATWPSGAPTVYIASGENYPDALSGGTLAGSQDAPVLLTRKGELPSATRSALADLDPSRIIVLGGTGAVSSTVATALRSYAPVERISGATRYDVSAQVAQRYASASTVYVASGQNFADALSASPLAGQQGQPLVLTRSDELPDAVAAQLARLRPARIVVLGGTGAINATVEAQLRTYSGSVTRITGADRYEVAAQVARLVPAPAQRAWIASGRSFPDALAAGPAAAKQGSALLLTRPTSLPSVTTSALHRLDPPRIYVAGGSGAVANSVVTALRWLTFR